MDSGNFVTVTSAVTSRAQSTTTASIPTKSSVKDDIQDPSKIRNKQRRRKVKIIFKRKRQGSNYDLNRNNVKLESSSSVNRESSSSVKPLQLQPRRKVIWSSYTFPPFPAATPSTIGSRFSSQRFRSTSNSSPHLESVQRTFSSSSFTRSARRTRRVRNFK